MNNIDFKFNLSVSTTCYTDKCTEWGKLRYTTKQMDIDSLEGHIKQGYCFTHTFKEVDKDGTLGCKQKTIANFKSTNVVFLDVDDSSLTASNFYTSVTHQPTLLYTTPSNITGEKNRFRLVYVFSEPILNNDSYRELVGKISCGIRQDFQDFVFDTTSVNVSQQMGGNARGDCQLFKSYNIFEFDTFKKYEDCISIYYKKKRRNDINNRNADSYDYSVITDKEFSSEFWEIDNDIGAYNFLEKYHDRYPLYDCTQVDDDIPYIPLDDGYVEISRRYYVKKDLEGKNYSIPVKIKQGNRERILFNNALLRLKINPDMSFEHLLYAMVYERQYWIDNSDGEFTNRRLYKITEGAYFNRAQYEISTSTQGQKRRRARTNKNGYKVNKSFCDKYGISAHSMANYMRTDITNDVLLANYDFTKTVKENSLLLKEKGIKPSSERRLYQFTRWCRENNLTQIKNKNNNEEI